MIKYLLDIPKTTECVSKTSRNFIFSKSKIPTPRNIKDLGYREEGIGVGEEVFGYRGWYERGVGEIMPP